MELGTAVAAAAAAPAASAADAIPPNGSITARPQIPKNPHKFTISPLLADFWVLQPASAGTNARRSSAERAEIRLIFKMISTLPARVPITEQSGADAIIHMMNLKT